MVSSLRKQSDTLNVRVKILKTIMRLRTSASSFRKLVSPTGPFVATVLRAPCAVRRAPPSALRPPPSSLLVRRRRPWLRAFASFTAISPRYSLTMVIQGVIRPPPEIRAVADRTALYVANNGRAFEARILGSAKGKTPKFAFLQPSSPFHAYYEQRVKFYEEGGEDGKEEDPEKEADTEKKPAEQATKQEPESASRKSVLDPVAKTLLTQRSKIAQFRADHKADATEGESITIPPPPTLQFVQIYAPASLTTAQIEIIQLTAQFTALDATGNFLAQLTHREWNNPAFGFCQPRHAQFAYFTALVDGYRKVLGMQGNEIVKAMAENVDTCLEMAAYRAEYERDAEEQARGREDTGVQIDWHDFVVVETIDFPIDEKVLLPPPPSLPVLKTVADDDEEDDEQIRVVQGYKPRIGAAGAKDVEMVIDPVTGKSVPVKDLPEHMRIQLLDPKWAEERRKFQEKQKESNLVGDDVVAKNLSRFTQQRGDTFDKKQREILSREQPAQQPPASSSGIARPAASMNPVDPAAKRPKLDLPPAQPTVMPVQPPLPPPPPPEDPFASGAQGGGFDQSSIRPENEFIASLSKPEVTLQIRIPNDASQMAWNFYGQIVSVTVDVRSTIRAVKEEVSKAHLNDMPINKIQLKGAQGFLNADNQSLAALNIGPTATLELRPKTRGGRR